MSRKTIVYLSTVGRVQLSKSDVLSKKIVEEYGALYKYNVWNCWDNK
jgi:hypothetical protein